MATDMDTLHILSLIEVRMAMGTAMDHTKGTILHIHTILPKRYPALLMVTVTVTIVSIMSHRSPPLEADPDLHLKFSKPY
jgi:hypothetical protein